MGVSQRELARILGVSQPAVRKAIATGRIKALPDGTLDPDDARQSWARSSEPGRTKVKTDRAPSAHVRSESDAREAVNLITRILNEEGVANDGTVDFAAARTADTILKARERELKMAQRRKELVPFASVKGHVERAFVAYRQAIQRLPSRFA